MDNPNQNSGEISLAQEHQPQQELTATLSTSDEVDPVLSNKPKSPRCCRICDSTIGEDAPLFEYCENGCELCEDCSFDKSVREVLMEKREDICMLCDTAKLLPGRSDPELFEKYIVLIFRTVVEQSSNRSLSLGEADRQSQVSGRSQSSRKSLHRRHSKKSKSKDGSHSARSFSSSKSVSRAPDTTGHNSISEATIQEDANIAGLPNSIEGNSDEHAYSFSFSGGVVDIRYHDLETIFSQNPIESQIIVHEYRRVKAHPLIKMMRVLNGEAPGKKRGRGSVSQPPVVRKLPMRLLIPEINEIYEQWLRKSKERGKALDLPEFVLKFAQDQYGMKTMSDEHLLSLVASVVAYEEHSERVATFAMVLGLSKPESYTPILSEVFYTIVCLIFEQTRDWRECLDMGDGLSWVPQDRVEVLKHGLYEAKSHAWLIEVSHEDCTRLKTPMPWSATTRSALDAYINRLASDPAEKGISRAKAKSISSVSCLDSMLKLAIGTWQAEWVRTLSHFERVEAEFLASEQRELETRAMIRLSASQRAFSSVEKDLLWELVGEVLAETDPIQEEMPRNASSPEWQALEARNLQRREYQLPFIRNRELQDLCEYYRIMVREREIQEAMRWDFHRWEWDEDWEWGGITLAENELPHDCSKTIHRTPMHASSLMHLPQYQGMKMKHTHGKDNMLSSPSNVLRRTQSTFAGAFDLSYFCVGSHHANVVTEALWRHQQPIETLSLCDNKFDDAACTAVIAAVSKHHNIHRCDLSCNLAGESTAAMLVKQVTSAFSNLVSLNLAQNRLTNAAAISILRAVDHHATLHELSIAGNGLGKDVELGKALSNLVGINSQRQLSVLQVLDLSWNRLVSSDIQDMLDELTMNNRHLRILKLDLNHISGESTEVLERCLGANATLEQVSLKHNKLRRVPDDPRLE